MQPTARFPLDFDALKKGDYISPEVVVDYYRVQRTDRKYPHALLKMRDLVEREVVRLGRRFMLKCERDGLRVLTDEEAVTYGASAFEADVRALSRTQRKMLTIDTANLSDQSRDRHARLLQRQAMQIVALRSARREVPILPQKRVAAPVLAGRKKQAEESEPL